MTQPWPRVQKQMIDKKAESRMQLAIDVITAIRNLKAEVRIAPAQDIKATLAGKDERAKNGLNEVARYITNLGRVETLTINVEPLRLKKGISAVVKDVRVFLELEGLLDIDKEIDKLTKEIEGLNLSLQAKEAHLKNKEFLMKAPLEVVEKEKEALRTGKEKLASLNKTIKELKK